MDGELIPFDGDELEAFWDEPTKEIRVGCKRVAENMGLDWKSQHRRLSEDELFAPHLTMVMMTTVTGEKETVTLPLRFVSMWLATVQPGRSKPYLRAKILRYREQAVDVLAKHFLGIAPRPEFGVTPDKSWDEIKAMFHDAAVAVTTLRTDLSTKITAEEARSIAEETVQEALKKQEGANPITPGKITLLQYLDKVGRASQAPQFWQDWIMYYDEASGIESPELVMQPHRNFPLRFYSYETHAEAFARYLTKDKHENWFKRRGTP